jgi:hypothetical protein
MDFGKVNNMVLFKYKSHFRLPLSQKDEKERVLKAIEQHYDEIEVEETEVIAKFLYCVANIGKVSGS